MTLRGGFCFLRPLHDALLITQTERVLEVRPERRGALKPHPLIQADGCYLMNTGFQPQNIDSLRSRMFRQMIDQQLPEALAAKLRTHVHALELPVLGAEQLDTAAAGGSTVSAQDEKRH